MSLDATSTAPVHEGEVIADKYRVDRVIGEGGMGVVVLVTHLGLQQHFAMKFLLPSVVTVPALVERFTREAQAAVKIHSEHVARVMDVGVLPNGAPYMLMEYLEGEDLAAVIKSRGALPVTDAVGFALQALEALAEAHVLGIVHRDLKPGNLFLAQRPSGRSIVKVLDFGISKIETSATQPALTGSGAPMGSPGYMSPEQMMSADTVDLTTDIWAMGVVLYEMLTGRRPFEAETMPELVAVVLAKPHVPARDLRADLPQGLSDVLDRCLAKPRTDRYQNVGQLAAALAPFAPPHVAQSVERILGVLREAAPTVAYSAPPPPGSVRSHGPGAFSPTSGGAVPLRSNAPLFAIGGVVVLALLGGGGALAWNAGHPDAGTAPLPSTGSLPLASASGAFIGTASSSPSASASAAQITSPPQSGADAGSTTTQALTTQKGRPQKGAASAASSSPPVSAAPKCRRVSFYDDRGEEHFKLECP